jgi:hypothetical protein
MPNGISSEKDPMPKGISSEPPTRSFADFKTKLEQAQGREGYLLSMIAVVDGCNFSFMQVAKDTCYLEKQKISSLKSKKSKKISSVQTVRFTKILIDCSSNLVI